MRIVPVHEAGPLLESLYRDVLVPSFPPEQLGTASGLSAPGRSGFVAVDPDGLVLGGAIGDWDPGARIVMLSFLAVRPGTRGGGVGGALLDTALEAWKSAYDPCLILAEVEDPDRHQASEAHGDPAARLRFYARRGGRALDLPFFQPAYGAGGERVRGMLLVVLHAALEFFADLEHLRPEPILAHLRDYQASDEGAVGVDAESVALWRALAHPVLLRR